MKTMFIEARKRTKLDESALEQIDKNIKLLDKLPQKIGLLAPVQYIHLLMPLKKYLEKNRKKVFISKGRVAKHEGQVLGCDVMAAERIKNKIDAFLFMGDSIFHSLEIVLLGRPVFVFNPENNELHEMSKEEMEQFKTRKKAALMKFYSANSIGIIVSLKHGQKNMVAALELKKKLEKKAKQAFIFICDNINLQELEDFRCDMWVNTACPAMHMEPKVLNINDINL